MLDINAYLHVVDIFSPAIELSIVRQNFIAFDKNMKILEIIQEYYGCKLLESWTVDNYFAESFKKLIGEWINQTAVIVFIKY